MQQAQAMAAKPNPVFVLISLGLGGVQLYAYAAYGDEATATTATSGGSYGDTGTPTICEYPIIATWLLVAGIVNLIAGVLINPLQLV